MVQINRDEAGRGVTLNRVLQIGPLPPSLERDMREHYDVVQLNDVPDGHLDEHGAGFTAAVANSRIGVDRALMERLPSLRVIVNFGVGYDAIDVEAAKERGIAVANTPDVLNDCVADTAVGGLIDVMRRLSAADRFVRRGDWARGPFPLATKVSGKKIGILGLGRIGRAVARRLEGFGVEIAYHSRSRVDGVPYERMDSPEKLAAWCDALIVATSGGAGTRGLVSAAVLEALGPDGYLVNISRGSVVDEPALVAALTGGRIAGAALDVFAHEPDVPAELLTLDSVVLLPHIGSATHETRRAMSDLAFRNLRTFLEQGTLITPVPEI